MRTKSFARSQQPGKRGKVATENSTKKAKARKSTRFTPSKTNGSLRKSPRLTQNQQIVKTELNKYSCAKCSEFIAFDALVQINKKAYHRECLLCSSCNERLNLTKAPIIKKGELFCVTCAKNDAKSRLFSPVSLLTRSVKNLRTIRSRKEAKESVKGHLKNRKNNFGSSSFFAENLDDNWETNSNITGYNLAFDTSGSEFEFEVVKERILNIRETYPNNMMAKTLDDDILKTIEDLSYEKQKRFFRCICSGIISPYHPVGALAMDEKDYQDFDFFFLNLIKTLSSLSPYAPLSADKEELKERYFQSFKRSYNLAQFVGLKSRKIKGFQFEITRNLNNFPMIGAMKIKLRYDLEQHLLPVFDLLHETEYKGEVVNVNHELRDTKVMKAEDSYDLLDEVDEEPSEREPDSSRAIELNDFITYREELNPYSIERKRYKLGSKYHGTSVSKKYPNAAGVYVSRDKQYRIFYNHEDHIKFEFLSTNCSSDIGSVYHQFSSFIQTFEKCYKQIHESKPSYIISDKLGYITTCPGIAGSGLFASVFLDLPELAEEDSMRKISEQYGFIFSRNLVSDEDKFRDARFRLSPIPKINNTEEMAIRDLFKLIPKVLKEEEKADAI